MGNYVWKPIFSGEISEEEELSLERMMNWVLSRRIAEQLVTAAAHDGQPLRFILKHGSEEVQVIEVRLRPESEATN